MKSNSAGAIAGNGRDAGAEGSAVMKLPDLAELAVRNLPRIHSAKFADYHWYLGGK